MAKRVRSDDMHADTLAVEHVTIALPTPIARWDLPTVSGKPFRRVAPARRSASSRIERRAYEEAFAKGREAGLAAARAETATADRQLKASGRAARCHARHARAAACRNWTRRSRSSWSHLALTVARQLVRRELRIDPAQVIAIIRETVALLPAAARDVRVHLHPEDAAVVREKLAAPDADRAWTIVEDPVMTRGGCRVTTDTAQIDARLETRINTVDQRAARR